MIVGALREEYPPKASLLFGVATSEKSQYGSDEAAGRVRAEFVKGHLNRALALVHDDPASPDASNIYVKFRQYVAWCADFLSESDSAEIDRQMNQLQSLLALNKFTQD